MVLIRLRRESKGNSRMRGVLLASASKSIPPIKVATFKAASVGSPRIVQPGFSPFGGTKRALLHNPAATSKPCRSCSGGDPPAGVVSATLPSNRIFPVGEYPTLVTENLPAGSQMLFT